MIYLLDLNYTLVENSENKVKPFTEQIEQEVYRADLIERLRGEKVIMITARPRMHTEQTLKHIKETTDLVLMDYWFNVGLMPPAAKHKAMIDYVFPKYGNDPTQYFAIESNPKTRAMYANLGIKALPYEDFMNKKGVVLNDRQRKLY